MKKSILSLLVLLIISVTLSAQDSGRVREIGVYTSNLSNFGLRYKWGNENIRFRITAADFSFVTSDGTTSFGIGAAVGIEKPKSITEKVSLYYGGQVSAHFYSSETDSYSTGIGFIAGASCQLSDAVYLSLECVPSLSFINTGSENVFSLDISNSAGITLGFRF